MPTEEEAESLVSQFGQKAATLIALGELGAGMLIPGGLQIPTVHPIAHRQILGLFRFAGLDIEKRWTDIVKECPEGSNLDDFIIEMAENENSLISKLRKDIISCSKSDTFKGLLKLSNYERSNQTVENLLSEKRPIMCRSSGDEDQGDISNPGGNESHLAECTIESVADQVGMVLASYFKPKSFAQRKIAGEEDSLKKLPQCSILLQELIGEDTVEDPTIPTTATCISGVVFTRKPDGYTDDLMLINATYGHGEGVVQSSVPNDLFVVCGKKLHIDQRIVNKTARIAPVGKGELSRVANTAEQAKKPTLTPTQVRKLQYICEKISEKYGNKPLDIEWVFTNNRFYILQVRELPEPKTSLNPSYVRPLDPAKILAKVQPIVPACDVRVIKSAEDCIIMENLTDALKYFLANRDKHKDIKAIFVKHGVTTSHEANLFRYIGIPVFVVDDHYAIKSMLQQSDITLCAQSSTIYTGTDLEIVRGWHTHPYRQDLTLYSQDLPQDLIKDILADQMPPISAEQTGVKALIEIINQSTDADESLNATKKIRRIITAIAKRLNDEIVDESLRKELSIVLQHIWIACGALSIAIGNNKLKALNKEQYELQIMFASRRLQTLIFQRPSNDSRQQLSMLQILDECKKQNSIIAEIQKVAEELELPLFDFTKRETALLIQAFKSASVCFNDEQNKAYKSYLVILAIKYPDEFIHMCKIISDYAQAGILSTAINLMNFNRELSDASIVQLYNEQREKHTNLYVTKTFAVIASAKQLCTTWRARVTDWSKYGNFETIFGQFSDFIRMYRDLLSLLENEKDLLATQVIVNAINEMLDVYDLSIKELGASTYPDLQTHIQDFKKLLQPYCELSSKLLLTLAAKDARKSSDIKDYEKAMRAKNELLLGKQTFDRSDLEPSLSFDVSASVFSANANPERTLKEMESLVDVFTLAHQNALAALGLYQKDTLDSTKLPAKLQLIIHGFINKIIVDTPHSETKSTAELISWSYDPPCVYLTFNIPCRSHSANINIKYDINKEEAEIELHMFMDNESNRCVNIRNFTRCKAGGKLSDGITFSGYNPIESVETRYKQGKFFKNIFKWVVNADDMKETEQLAMIINQMFVCSFDVEYLGKTMPQLDYIDQVYYAPGMFEQSFAGLDKVVQNISYSAENMERNMQLMTEVMSTLIKRLEVGPQAEIELLADYADSLLKLILTLSRTNSEAKSMFVGYKPIIEMAIKDKKITDAKLVHAFAVIFKDLDKSETESENLCGYVLEHCSTDSRRHVEHLSDTVFAYNHQVEEANLKDAFMSNKVAAYSMRQARAYAKLVEHEIYHKSAIEREITAVQIGRAIVQMIRMVNDPDFTMQDYTTLNNLVHKYFSIAEKKKGLSRPNPLSTIYDDLDLTQVNQTPKDITVNFLEKAIKSIDICSDEFFSVWNILLTASRMQDLPTIFNILLDQVEGIALLTIDESQNAIILKNIRKLNNDMLGMMERFNEDIIVDRFRGMLNAHGDISAYASSYMLELACVIIPGENNAILQKLVEEKDVRIFIQNFNLAFVNFNETLSGTDLSACQILYKWISLNPVNLSELANTLSEFDEVPITKAFNHILKQACQNSYRIFSEDSAIEILLNLSRVICNISEITYDQKVHFQEAVIALFSDLKMDGGIHKQVVGLVIELGKKFTFRQLLTGEISTHILGLNLNDEEIISMGMEYQENPNILSFLLIQAISRSKISVANQLLQSLDEKVKTEVLACALEYAMNFIPPTYSLSDLVQIDSLLPAKFKNVSATGETHEVDVLSFCREYNYGGLRLMIEVVKYKDKFEDFNRVVTENLLNCIDDYVKSVQSEKKTTSKLCEYYVVVLINAYIEDLSRNTDNDSLVFEKIMEFLMVYHEHHRYQDHDDFSKRIAELGIEINWENIKQFMLESLDNVYDAQPYQHKDVDRTTSGEYMEKKEIIEKFFPSSKVAIRPSSR